MRIIGVVGWSGSGKTTLVEKLISRLIAHGLTVSTMKHAHHGFDLDRPGKDSFRHRAAGACETMILSSSRWALMREIRNGAEPTMEALIERMTPVDLLIVEGFKSHPYDKIEVHRPSLGKELRAGADPDIIAVASDVKLGGLTVPVLDLNDADVVAAFVLQHCGFAVAPAQKR